MSPSQEARLQSTPGRRTQKTPRRAGFFARFDLCVSLDAKLYQPTNQGSWQETPESSVLATSQAQEQAGKQQAKTEYAQLTRLRHVHGGRSVGVGVADIALGTAPATRHDPTTSAAAKIGGKALDVRHR